LSQVAGWGAQGYVTISVRLDLFRHIVRAEYAGRGGLVQVTLEPLLAPRALLHMGFERAMLGAGQLLG
jgi:hypothetical protein